MRNKASILANHFSTTQMIEVPVEQAKQITSFALNDLLIQYSEESFLIVDTDLVIINFSNNFSKQYQQYFGKEILKGKNILDYAPANRVEIAKKTYQKALQGNTFELEIEIPLQNGISYCCLNKYKAIYDNAGQIIGVFVSSFNITPTKKAQQEINKHENRYHSIIENSIDAFFLSNPDGSIIEVNNAAMNIFGYNPEEFKLLKHHDLINYNDPSFTAHLNDRQIPDKLKGEAMGIHKSGNKFPLEFSSVLYQDINDETKVGTFISDISIRKNAEKIIELSEKRFRALIENTTDIILLTDAKGMILYASPAFSRVTGYNLDEIHKNPQIVVTAIHPDFTKDVKITYYESLANPGVPISRLLQFRHKSGHYIWLEGVITNMLDVENVAAIVSNYRDISRRKAAEAQAIKIENRFQALVENAEDIIILLNADGIILYVSPSFEKLTGFNANEIVGGPNMPLMHPEQAHETKAIFKKLLKTPGLAIPRINRLKHKNGHYIWVEGYITNLLHDDNVQAIVSNYHDITERIKAAELIRQSEINLTTIFENTSEAFLLMDTNRIVKAFNSNAKKIGFLNRDRELKIGYDALDFIDDSRKDFVKSLFDRALGGEHLQYDRMYQHDNGEIYWVDFSIKLVVENGQSAGLCITGRDITARKLAEEELTKRELRFRSILKNSHDMLFLFDAEGKIEFLSPAIERLFGYESHEVEIQNILDSIHPHDFENVMHQLREAFHNPDVPVSIRFRKQKRDGSYVWLEGTLTNMLPNPDINVMVANFRDITERKLFEEQQALFVSIVNSSEDAILSISLENIILTWNKGAEKLFNYTAEEVIGQNCNLILPQDRYQEEIEIIDKIKKGISVNFYETQRLNKNGQLTDISLIISPIKDSNGRITGASKIARDISDKKKAEDTIKNNEKRFRSLLQNSNDGLSLLTVDGVMLEISPTGKKITGFEEDEMIGQARYDLIHPDDLEHVSQAFIDVIEDPEKTRNFEYRSLTKDGTYKWLEACCQNLLYEPAVGAIVINYRDITERKNQEIEREQLIKTLNQNNNDLRNFSYITSHNLKAPLSNLMGFIDLLDYTLIEDPSLKPIIEGFKASTILLNNTVNDLVKILIIRDSDSIEQKEIGFNNMFLQVKGQLKSLIEEVQPIIELHFEKAPQVVFNETYLESIFMNLLTNAVKYRSYERKLKIRIESHHTDDGIVLTFTDNGIGFDVERHKSKVFGLYQRFHDRPNSKGLGLYLIKSQMESLQGTIEVDSTVDIGTTFILKFAPTP
ncbi:PAS domain S-box protein [Emticicia sp. BO119]|uniref:PAS domain-containing protein n=1 Tax=Emticicia sp. BO119 TaxID=2757768 RepID=UPI0015F114A3|nr:PAS domain S-box protein [Emticicia sp. BO119]MBA4849440.1 PAS domain S-box protein [Emticicia sp. BO119]